MRIQDWDIQTYAVSGYEIAQQTENGDSTVNGLSRRNVRLNKASIYINQENPDDWYETLVHELIHVQTTPLYYCAFSYFHKRHSYFDDIYESLVDKQAQIFCKLYPISKLSMQPEG